MHILLTLFCTRYLDLIHRVIHSFCGKDYSSCRHKGLAVVAGFMVSVFDKKRLSALTCRGKLG